MDASRRFFLRGRATRENTETSPAGEAAAHGDRNAAPAPGGIPRITDACLAHQRIECRVCGERCDEGAIVFRPTLGGVARPVLRAERCTGCGDCLDACPTQALRAPTSA